MPITNYTFHILDLKMGPVPLLGDLRTCVRVFLAVTMGSTDTERPRVWDPKWLASFMQ